MALYSLNTSATRVMFTSATAETAYPTGVALGLKGQADAAAGDVNGAADTRTLTATSSFFAPQTGVQPQRHAILRSIEVLTVGGTAPTIKLRDHAGQKDLTILYDGSAKAKFEFGVGGLPILGGFCVITDASAGAAPVCQIIYDVVTN